MPADPSASSTAPPRPGWYPDPRELVDPEPEPGYRWWDGSGWTAWLADSAYAPAPRGDAPRVEPRVQSSPPRSPRGLIAALIVCVLLLGLTAVSLYGRSRPEPVPQAATPSALGTPRRVLSPWSFRSRTVIVSERLEMTLADGFTPDFSKQELPGFVPYCWIANESARFKDPQAAAQVLGSVDPALVVPGDATATAQKVYLALGERFNKKLPLQWGTPTIEPWPGIPGAVRLSAELRYQTAESRIPEAVTMLILPWEKDDQSGMAMWLTLVPQDTSATTLAALKASERSIKLVG